jgi:CheY-like chemotaxis protein
MLLRQVLENVGCQVRVGQNGKEGIEICNEWKPALIFMDIRMPVMDGLEATRRLRAGEGDPELRIVGVSAHVFREETEAILDSGMDDFIRKPFRFGDVYAALEKNLGATFVYHEKPLLEKNQWPLLKRELLEGVDESLLLNLLSSVEKLDREAILKYANDISLGHARTANVLQQYIAAYRYTEIYRLLNEHFAVSKTQSV